MVLRLHLIPFISVILAILSFCSTLAAPSMSLNLQEDHLPPYKSANSTNYYSAHHQSQAAVIRAVNRTAGFVYPDHQQRSVLLVNGTTDDSFIVTFILEPDTSPSNYTFVFLSNDSRILKVPEDVSSMRTETSSDINATVALDFHLFPGRVQLSIEARRIPDKSLVGVYKADFIVAGLAIFIKESDTLISGAGRSLTIPSYESLYQKPHREYGVFVQYTNGSDSDSNKVCRHSCMEGSVRPLYIESISVEFMSYGGQVLWDHSLCSLNNGNRINNTLQLKTECGIGIAPTYLNGTKYDGLRFALDFQPYRVGELGIFLNWNDFTLGSDLEGEEMTNYVILRIGGQPPCVVRRIEPANPFDKEGGEELYVETINTADANMISFNVNDVPFDLIPGSRSIIRGPDDYYEVSKFLTKSGRGRRLPWSITATRLQNGSVTPVQFIDETGFLFSYNDDDIVLNEITPSSISEYGDVRVTLSGEFPQFDADAPNHDIIIGNIPLERDRCISFSINEIIILVPPRSSIGASWRFSVFIQIEEAFSNEAELSFLPSSIELRGVIFGASTNPENGNYNIGPCGLTTFIVTVINQEENKDVTYQWKLFDRANNEYLNNVSSITTNTDTLQLPNTFLPRFNEVFYVMGIASFSNLTKTQTFKVEKIDVHVIGVTLLQPENRTISVPVVNVRIIAKIEVSECVGTMNELVYQWELENKSRTLDVTDRFRRRHLNAQNSSVEPEFDLYKFSYENDTGTNDDEVTPTRLGREFIIPREMAENGTHQIQLTVKGRIITGVAAQSIGGNESSDIIISGFDATTFTINESPLVAVIGSGQTSSRISDSETLVMSSEGSFDPDILDTDQNRIGLSFEWSCGFSYFANLSNISPCISSLLPNYTSSGNVSSFEIPSSTLQMISTNSIQSNEGQSVYLRYQVIVRKFNRESNASQTLLLTRSSGLPIARYNRIEIVNSRDETVNCDAVEFWEDVIIRPIAPLSTEWKFRLERPVKERSRFLKRSENLISSAGYYIVPGHGAPEFQQLPLGIQADRLQPKQSYEFLVSFQEADRLRDDVTLLITTVEVPELVFPDIAIANGSMYTVFRATASTSFKGNSQFTYQFYLIELGRNSSEYCVDGCTGGHIVRFQVQKAGLYVLQCRLFAANGKRLLAMKNNTKIVTVFPSSFPPTSSLSLSASVHVSTGSLSELDGDMMRDYRLGDDGWVTQRGFYASEWLYEKSLQVTSVTESYDLCANYTSKWIEVTRHIVTNELPNSANARNYIILATNYIRIECVENEDALYELLTIVDRSISKTPREELLTTQSKSLPGVELHEDLRRFYNFTFCKAAQLVVKGSSRHRLRGQPGIVHNLIVDVAELSIEHLTAAATSGRVCGWQGEYNFGTRDGMPDCLQSSTPSSMPGQRLGVTSVQVAVKCNREQGTSLHTRYASFEWCDAVYDLSGDTRKLVTLAEIFDYPYLSGIQAANFSETERIVLLQISSLEKHNKLGSIVSSISLQALQAAKARSGRNSSSCYKIGMTMAPPPSHIISGCMRNVPFRMSPQKQVGYRVSKPFQGGFYARNIEDVILTEDSDNSSFKVFASSNELGLYGAYRSSCNDHFSGMISSGSLLLAGVFIGILILIIIITGLTYVLLTIILGATNRSERDSDGGVVMDETYVDRDYFGRKNYVHLDVGSHAGSSNASSYYETSQQAMIGMENMESKPSGESSATFWKSSSGPRHTIDEERLESEGRINKKDSN